MIDENFPEIIRPDRSLLHKLDCKIDINQDFQEINFEELVTEFIKFFYIDYHYLSYELLMHLDEMLDKGLVRDNQGKILDKESKNVREFKNTEEVKITIDVESGVAFLYN